MRQWESERERERERERRKTAIEEGKDKRGVIKKLLVGRGDREILVHGCMAMAGRNIRGEKEQGEGGGKYMEIIITLRQSAVSRSFTCTVPYLSLLYLTYIRMRLFIHVALRRIVYNTHVRIRETWESLQRARFCDKSRPHAHAVCIDEAASSDDCASSFPY